MLEKGFKYILIELKPKNGILVIFSKKKRNGDIMFELLKICDVKTAI